MPKPFRIAYVLKRYPRLSETFIVNEMTELKRQGIEVVIVAFKDPGEPLVHDKTRALGAPIYYLPAKSAIAKGLATKSVDRYGGMERVLTVEALQGRLSQDEYFTLLAASSFAPLLQAMGVDHIHAHFATAATAAAAFLSRLTGIPYSFTAHAKDIFHDSVDRRTLAERIEGAKFVITVSDFNKRYLEELLRTEKRQGCILRLYNGIDLSLFRFGEIDAEPQRIVAVGRLVQKKGFAYLIEALRLLKEKGKRVRCDIIGEGEDRENLERMIAESSLAPLVSLPGAKTQTEVIRMMQRAQALVLPCIVGDDGNRDGLPTTLLEAMALGVPVVSTRVTGIPEIISDGVDGLLVEQKDAAALARAIESLLNAAPLREKLRQAALAKIRENFDLHRNVARLKDIFLQRRAVENPVSLS